jgi:hypothetical protein
VTVDAGPAAAPSTLALAATGFALGWNLAWVPGPIHAEMLRRGARLRGGLRRRRRRLLARLPGPALDAALRALAAGFLLWLGGRTALLLLPEG